MHELSLVTAIIDSACKTAQDAGATRVRAVNLTIGALRDFQPDLAKSCFAHFSKGTFADGAALSIHIAPLRVCCNACHIVYDIENPTGCVQPICPDHPEAGCTIVSGDELAIDSIEVA